MVGRSAAGVDAATLDFPGAMAAPTQPGPTRPPCPLPTSPSLASGLALLVTSAPPACTGKGGKKTWVGKWRVYSDGEKGKKLFLAIFIAVNGKVASGVHSPKWVKFTLTELLLSYLCFGCCDYSWPCDNSNTNSC